MEHKFKIGDKVRFVYSDSPFKVGDEGEIIELLEFTMWPYRVRGRIGRDGKIREGVVREDSITLITDTKVPIHNFKPDGCMRVKSREYILAHPGTYSFITAMELLCGSEIKIDQYDNTDNTYYACGLWWPADWLEPVEAERSKNAVERYIEGLRIAIRSKPLSSDIPLINKSKLLTTIKLD